MSGSHKTSAITRPPSSVRAALREPADRRVTDQDPSRFADFTRPIRSDRQLVTRRANRWLLALFGIVVLSALLAALFVLPVQAWLRQEDHIVMKQADLDVLTSANNELAVEIGHLQTPEGAKEAARDELGVVGPGEERISVLADSAMILVLPSGWPYDTVSQIVAVRAVTAPAIAPAPAPAPAIP